MLCDNCHNRVANVHLTQIINNKKVDIHLCENCARENNYMNFSGIYDISDFFNSILGFTEQPYINTPKQETCKGCGMTFDDFKRTGKFGCADCYNTFADKIEPIVRRIHGSVVHGGRTPKSAEPVVNKLNEVDMLKKQLEDAIKVENFEEAAKLRDKIKATETGKGE